MSVNKVILVGRLGQKPELRNTPGGAAVANFSIATNENWMDRNNQKQERTEWHRIVVWGKVAQLCHDYLDKGRQVYLEGRLQTRQWQDKDGATKYTTEVIASTVQFLDKGEGKGMSSQGASGYDSMASGPGPSSNAGYGASLSSQGGAALSMESSSLTEEDIPF